MFEVIFLVVLSLVWVIFAVVQDLKSREIANWLNFSLIIFALGFRFLYSLFSEDFNFFYQGLIGLGIFFVLGNALYYGKMFAGGDSKLMIALGVIIPFYNNFLDNMKFFALFLLVFLFSGAIYGLIYSAVLGLKNRKLVRKEFSKQFKKGKKIFYFLMVFGILFSILGLIENIFMFLGILMFASPLLYAYSKTIEQVCMIKEINTKLLTEGDWLYNDVRIGRKWIKKSWDGLTKEDIKRIKKKYRKIKIKQGIPFSPVFLIAYLIILVIYFSGINLLNILFFFY